MKKEIPQINSSEVRYIPDSQYVLLPNGNVARVLTPSIKSNKKYYSLCIKKKPRQISIDDIIKMTK